MQAKFRNVKKVLKKRDIHWHPELGKGSHGLFKGFDSQGQRRVYPIPKEHQTEIGEIYLRGLASRFGIPLSELKG